MENLRKDTKNILPLSKNSLKKSSCKQKFGKKVILRTSVPTNARPLNVPVLVKEGTAIGPLRTKNGTGFYVNA